MININNDYIYEILWFNSSSELTIEYLINFDLNKFKDINQFNNYVFQYFINNGLQKLISYGNPIRTENDNMILNIYPINYNKLRNSIINDNNPSKILKNIKKKL